MELLALVETSELFRIADDDEKATLERLMRRAHSKQHLGPPNPATPFQLELSDFRRVTLRNGSKALRCTLTWRFTHPDLGTLGESLEGCLVTYSERKGYQFAPPLSRFGPMQSKQLCAITVDYHDLIIKMLRNHKTKSGQSYLDYIGEDPKLQFFKAEPMETVDPELPAEISTVQEAEIEEGNVESND